jgi:alpha-L-fucosidase
MSRRDLLRSIFSPLALATGRRPFGQQNRFQPTGESLDRRPSPAWYPAARFGIFIHWGVYSVPACAPVNVKDENPYAEWYWNSLTEGIKATAATGHGALTWKFHQRVYGANFPYFDFAPLFLAELYDPDRWTDVFVRSGAKYVALTAKHHDGFILWRSAEANRAWGRPWNSVDIGPRRDLLLDLMEAGRRRDLRMGIYYSLYEWYNPLWLAGRQRYVAKHMFPQFKDVVTHAKPSIVFSDGEWELTSAEWRTPELLAWLFNESPVRDEVVVNDRWGKEARHHHGGYFTTEYTPGMTGSDRPWEENRGMGYSYGYNRMESLADYRTDRELLMMLIDIVSRGGNLLLDIGPTGDGRIPVIMEERLTQIGDWLRPNGEAIYNTRARKVTRQWSHGKVPQLEEKDFMSDYPIDRLVDSPAPGFARVEAFFTAGDSAVYAILPRRPLQDVVLDAVDAPSGVRVTLLEGGQPLEAARQGSQLRIRIPDSLAAALPSRQDYVLKIEGAK